ncbi:MAG: hypothetical protein ACYTBX_01090 [Planctomycetota bacterium]|jgi:hypothetical protein
MAEHIEGPRFAGTNKTGLHKEISSIFKGVPVPDVPDNDSVQQPSRAPAADHIDYPTAEQSAPEVPNLQKPQTPEPCQPAQPLQAAPAQQPKTDKTDIEESASDRPTTVKVISPTFWQRMKDKLFAPKSGVSTSRQKAMVVMVPVLSIVLILVLVKVFGVPSRTIAEYREVEPAGTVAAFAHEIDWEIPAPYPKIYRDPMRFGSAITASSATEKLTDGSTRKLNIKSIVYSEDNPSVVIGNRIVHEGEKVLGATVVKINKDSVEFEMGEKKWKQNVRE